MFFVGYDVQQVDLVHAWKVMVESAVDIGSIYTLRSMYVKCTTYIFASKATTKKLKRGERRLYYQLERRETRKTKNAFLYNT